MTESIWNTAQNTINIPVLFRQDWARFKEPARGGPKEPSGSAKEEHVHVLVFISHKGQDDQTGGRTHETDGVEHTELVDLADEVDAVRDETCKA